MYFSSFSALWSMDGHGAYVWSCYAIVAIVFLLLVLQPMLRFRQEQKRIRLSRGVTAGSADVMPSNARETVGE